MLFDDLMFGRNTAIKFRLYRSLFVQPKGIYQIHFFAEQFGLNYQQAMVFFTSIDENLKEIDVNQLPLLCGSGKVNVENLKIGVDEYRYFLLQRSTPFLLIQSILNDEKMTVDEFCEKYNVSRSTVSRKLSPISKFLKYYNIRITYTPLNIIGDEVLIRLTLFYFYWIGARNVAWPFKVSREEVKKIQEQFPKFFSMKHSYVGSKELDYFVAIFASRVEQGYIVNDYVQWTAFFEKHSVYKNITLEGFPNLKKEDRLSETRFLFFLNHYIPYYDSGDQAIIAQTLKNFYRGFGSHPLINMNQRFIKFANKEFFNGALDEKTREILMANLTNIGFSYFVLGSPVPDFEVLASPLYSESDLHRVLEARVRKFFEYLFSNVAYSRFRASKENIIRRYTNIIFPQYMEQRSKKQLNVAIAIERNQILLLRLRSFLSTLNFVNCLDFTPQEVENYDLVITSTTSVVSDFPTLQIFYWDIEYGQQELYYLFQYLQTMYLKHHSGL